MITDHRYDMKDNAKSLCLLDYVTDIGHYLVRKDLKVEIM